MPFWLEKHFDVRYLLMTTSKTYFMGIINFSSFSYLEEKENPELP
jgi:hypothetical protein